MPAWYEDLNLRRDIDVLWLGKRGSQRRSQLLDQLRSKLTLHGLNFHVVDNVENPYVFGCERTAMQSDENPLALQIGGDTALAANFAPAANLYLPVIHQAALDAAASCE